MPRARQSQDNPYIEPQHLLLALLEQDDGGTVSLLAARGQCATLEEALKASIGRLPKVEGQDGEISVSRELTSLLNLTDKGAQKRGRPVHRLRAVSSGTGGRQGRNRQTAKEPRLNRKALEQAIEAVRGGEAVQSQEQKGAAKH